MDEKGRCAYYPCQGCQKRNRIRWRLHPRPRCRPFRHARSERSRLTSYPCCKARPRAPYGSLCHPLKLMTVQISTTTIVSLTISPLYTKWDFLILQRWASPLTHAEISIFVSTLSTFFKKCKPRSKGSYRPRRSVGRDCACFTDYQHEDNYSDKIFYSKSYWSFVRLMPPDKFS